MRAAIYNRQDRRELATCRSRHGKRAARSVYFRIHLQGNIILNSTVISNPELLVSPADVWGAFGRRAGVSAGACPHPAPASPTAFWGP